LRTLARHFRESTNGGRIGSAEAIGSSGVTGGWFLPLWPTKRQLR
jgi:hypothetical protein